MHGVLLNMGAIRQFNATRFGALSIGSMLIFQDSRNTLPYLR